MKTFKTILLVVAITFSSVLVASTDPIKNSTKTTISEVVGDLLEKPKFHIESDEVINVYFFINKNNEIVVLSVETENSTLEDFVKSRLNYKKVPKEIAQTKRFKIPVKILKSK
ncbi:hypothetical protein [uncultured Winogradskyella sp.]|uniref:hypothetical protein n=1 Tax=Winogradskyella sp. 4-2091 TaxID=3381659 RepID=UPI00261E2492|nr:hypothetical protein [uncultured Winogradskyella sp.]